MNENEELRQKIVHHFGEAAYENNQLNRHHIAMQVFNDDKKLSLLNSLVHPVTIADAEKWMKLQTTPYALKEAALIFEAGSQRQLDYVIGVSSPLELRIERVKQREHISREKVLERISKQMDEEEKMKRCDFVINNDEQQMLIPQVLTLHETLLRSVPKR